MIPRASEGQGNIECCDRPRRHGRLLQRLAQAVPVMRVAVLVAMVLAVLTVVVIVLVTDRNIHPHPHTFSDGRTCGSVEVTGNASLLEVYASCVTIEGNLRIQLIEYTNETNILLGLPNLVQVTGYVVIYRLSYLQTLRHLLPRLAVIRGQELFHGYSLVIFGNIILQEVNLGNLTHVLAGAVRVEKNLCRGPPHRWNMLSPSPRLNVIQEYGACIYPMCEEQRNCTNVTSPLNTLCTTYGGCYQGSQCHSECAGGCHTPHDPTACVACRNYKDGGTCVPDCSASVTNRVHHLGYRCIHEDECSKEPWTLKTEVGRDEVGQLFCIRCSDNCYGTCHGTKVTTANMGRQLRNCQWLEGNLEIMASGGRNLMQQLEENLGNLELVTGYLKVIGSDTLFSLNFLSSLKVIGGEELVHGRYALYVLDNEKLHELWDWSHGNRSLNITNGKLFFQHNPSLCQDLINELAVKGGKNLKEDVHVSPAEHTGPCYKTDLEVRVVAQPNRTLSVSWKYHFNGYDDRFVIGYYLYYREAPEEVRIYQGRDACNDNVVWEREFREYERNKSTKVILDKLKPYTQYAVYVDVYYTDSVKSASRSAISYTRTNVTDPSPVRSLKAEQQNSSALTVSWLPPAVANGPLNIYEVKYARLKHASSASQYLDRDDVCEDGKYEQNREASSIVPFDGEEKDADAHCCNCSRSTTSLSIEDRVFDRQLDINFQNYVWQSMLCKRVIVDDNNDTTTIVIPSESPRPDTTTSASPGAEHSMRRRRRDTITPKGTQNRQENKIDVKEEAEVCKSVRATTTYGATEECNEKIMTTTTTSVKLTGLRHLTSYRVWVRPCHYEGSNCSDWSVLEVTTTANMSLYKIQNFKVKEVKINETKQVHAAMISNNSNLRHSASHSTTILPGTTLVLSWKPPTVPIDDVLAYIIQYRREGGLEKKECVLEDEAHRNEYVFSLRGIKFGKYFLQIKLRTRNGDGPATTLTVTVKDDNIYWIVLIPFLCGGVLGICIMEMALWWKRRRTAVELEGIQPANQDLTYGELLLRSTLEHLEDGSVIGSEALQVDMEHKLGEGYFGKVFRGKMTLSSGEEKLVAVKTLSKDASQQDVKRFLQEAVVMEGIKSNFVVRLIGVVKNYPPIYVVMELMEHGDLKTFLRKETEALLTDEKMVEMAVEAADGMAYLEAKKLVHRDLAARNCMLDKDLTLKIGDFGLTRYVMTDYYYKKQSRGMLPVRWMAPESLKYGRYSARSDVWSYGVLLWELATGGLFPYEGYKNETLGGLIISGLRLKPPSRGPEFFYTIMKECWDPIPKKRPTFKRIVQRLLPVTSKRYLEFFQSVSFFHGSTCDSENLDDIDEGFNASGSSQEEAEAEHSRSSSALPSSHFREQDNNFSKDGFESQSNEDDTAVDDDKFFLTPEGPYERSSCAPLSCLTGQAGHFTPPNDATNKALLFHKPCCAES